MSKRAADILFLVLMALLVIVFFWTFFGLKDWLESYGVPKFIAFVGPLGFSLIGAATISHYRPKWLGDD